MRASDHFASNSWERFTTSASSAPARWATASRRPARLPDSTAVMVDVQETAVARGLADDRRQLRPPGQEGQAHRGRQGRGARPDQGQHVLRRPRSPATSSSRPPRRIWSSSSRSSGRSMRSRKPGALIASNTSSISITTLAAVMTAPRRVSRRAFLQSGAADGAGGAGARTADVGRDRRGRRRDSSSGSTRRRSSCGIRRASPSTASCARCSTRRCSRCRKGWRPRRTSTTG